MEWEHGRQSLRRYKVQTIPVNSNVKAIRSSKMNSLIQIIILPSKKNLDKHVKSHKLHATAQAPIPEWRKIGQFMKNIKCSNLQNDYRNLKDSSLYQSFTAICNKLNENYRTMIQQGILKPVSGFRRKINAVDSNGGNEPHRGGRGCGYG